MENLNLVTGVIVPYFNFFLFLAMLIFFARKPLKNMVASRHQAFQALAEESKKLMEEAKKKNDEISARLANLDQEIAKIRDFQRLSAESEAKDIIDGAKLLADHLLKEAKLVAEAEVERAKINLKKQIVDEINKLTVEKIQKDFSGSEQKIYFKKQLEKLHNLSLEA